MICKTNYFYMLLFLQEKHKNRLYTHDSTKMSRIHINFFEQFQNKHRRLSLVNNTMLIETPAKLNVATSCFI